jgi:UDP-2,3-diacylglucosamine hydrolase
MATLFISDLHLDDSRPAITELFGAFLQREAQNADALYVLGDLFEAWVGDDDDSALAQTVRDALRAASQQVPVFFMHGNRDFLIGERFCRDTGVQLLDDPAVVDLYGSPVVLMHGDTLCTDDHEYQAYRKVVRDPAWQKDVLSRPLGERRALAEQFRADSQSHTSTKAEMIMDVNAGAVDEVFRHNSVNLIIHGHTHRPAVHDLRIDGRDAQRIVLGDWYEQGSVLRVDDSGFRLETL